MGSNWQGAATLTNRSYIVVQVKIPNVGAAFS